MTFAAFLAGCWASHTNTYERDADGRLILRCQDCRQVTRLNESEMIRHQKPQQVLGEPTGRARVQPAGHVSRFRKAGER